MRVTPAAVAELEMSRRIDSLHWFCCFLTDVATRNLNLRFRNLEAESRADLHSRWRPWQKNRQLLCLSERPKYYLWAIIAIPCHMVNPWPSDPDAAEWALK